MHEGCDGQSNAAIGALRALVGRRGLHATAIGPDVVRAGEHGACPLWLQGGAKRVDAIGADIAEDPRVQSCHYPLARGRQARFDDLLPGVSGGQQVLAAVLDPLHRRAERAGQPGHHDLFRIHLRLGAEPAPDIGDHDPHVGLGEAE